MLLLATMLAVTTFGFDQNPTLAGLPDNTALDLGYYDCVDRTGFWDCRGITDYGGFVYDSDHHQMLMFGGGHATTFRDDIDVFHFDSLVWRSAYASTPCDDMTEANMHPDGHWRSTGHPYSVHTYDKIIYAPNAGCFLNLMKNGTSGKGHCIDWSWNPGPDTKIHHWDPDQNVWTVSKAGGLSGYGAAEYDPVSSMVVYIDRYGLWTYDPVNQVVTQYLNWIDGDIGYANNLVYFPPNQKMYFFARGETTEVFEMTPDRSDWANTTVELVTGVSGTKPNTSEAGFAYDVVNEVIGGGVKDNKFYIYDPITKSWQHMTPNVQSTSRDTVGKMDFHAIDYDPVNNVFIFITTRASGKRTWAYKYKNGGSVISQAPVNGDEGIGIAAQPNPFNRTVKIMVRRYAYGVRRISSQIYDIKGKLIKNFTPYASRITPYTFTWNAAHHPAGIYIIRLKTDKGQYTKRIFLQK
jgi:hypothetical protein